MLQKRSALTLVEVLVAIALLGMFFALIAPFHRSAREPARRNTCMNNLKQIALALLEYESENGTLPPAYTVDAEGNRLHSWRTLILPYLEESQLFESIDLSKPWDDPANAKARKTPVELYMCPSSPDEPHLTNYLAVCGPDCIFSDSVPRKLSEITDGQESTIAVIDVGPDHPVHWMSPNDITIEEVLEFNIESRVNHPENILAIFMDGHATALSLEIDKEALRALLTIAGGEKIAENF